MTPSLPTRRSSDLRPRGARPPGRTRRGVARAARRGRRRRPQARLPLAGVQPRGQHAVLQVGRRGADPHRPRPQVLDRAAARAGAEHRVAAVVETDIKRRGLMLVLSSPSGAGKTTISRRLLDSDDNLSLSISATTRPPGPGEAEGKDYFFVAQDRFAAMVAGGELLEHAVVFGDRKSTRLNSSH